MDWQLMGPIASASCSPERRPQHRGRAAARWCPETPTWGLHLHLRRAGPPDPERRAESRLHLDLGHRDQGHRQARHGCQLTKTIAGAAGKVQCQSYVYDSLGKLTNRADANTGLSEDFEYDTLNRLYPSRS